MIPMTLQEIAAVVGGEVHGDPGGEQPVTVTAPAFIDSRSPAVGGLFVAFVGERVDGHDFAAAALDGGAAAVLGTRPVGGPCVVVADPMEALSTLAQHVLAQLPDVRVVALTGSQGKTSTKDLLAQVLASAGTTVATAGSFNNEIGLPLTVLRADADTEFLVLEMGARGIGHLAPLCEIAPPDVSLVLNVGKAHIGEFGTQEDIAQAKGEIVEALTGRGHSGPQRRRHPGAGDGPSLAWTRPDLRRVGRGRRTPRGTASRRARPPSLRAGDRGRVGLGRAHPGR